MLINKVKYYRIKNNYSVQELAEKIGVTRQHLNQVDCGKCNLTDKVAVKLSEVFDVTVDDLRGKKDV